MVRDAWFASNQQVKVSSKTIKGNPYTLSVQAVPYRLGT